MRSIPSGINSSAGESTSDEPSRDTAEARLEPSELERFETLMLPHLGAARRLARHLTGNDADADDVVQESYLRALRHFGGFRGDGATQSRGWMLTIVRNTAYSWHHRRRPETEAAAFDEALHSDAASDGFAAELARNDSRETLSQALDRLPPDLREVIILRELEGLSYKEIGDVVDVPIGTVMSRLSRARQRLQAALLGAAKEGR
jgi:RNA polymerase sigma factor (sigma-70 family)